MVAVAPGRLAPIDEHGRQVRGHGPRRCAEQAGVDRPTLAGVLCEAQGGQDAQGEGQPGGVVTLSGPRHGGDHPGVRHGGDHRPAAEEGCDVVAGAQRVGARHPVAGEAGVHQLRVDLPQCGPVEPEALLAVGEKVAQEHIGAGDQPPHEVGALGAVEGDGHRLLAPVVDQEAVVEVRGPGFELGRAGHAPPGIAPQGLDLDHDGAEVGQDRPGARRGDEVGDLDDPDTIERCLHLGPPWLVRHDVLLLPSTDCADTPRHHDGNAPATARSSRDTTTLLNGCGGHVGARLYSRPCMGTATPAVPCLPESSGRPPSSADVSLLASNLNIGSGSDHCRRPSARTSRGS